MLSLITLLLIIGALGTSMLRADSPAWLLYSVLFIFGASAIGWNGVYLAEIARQAPLGQAGIATGGTLFITFMGVVLGPPSFGMLAGAVHSYGMSYGFLAIPGIIILVLLLQLRRTTQS